MQQTTLIAEIVNAVDLIEASRVRILRIVFSAHGYRQFRYEDGPYTVSYSGPNGEIKVLGIPVVVDNFQTERWTIVCGEVS